MRLDHVQLNVSDLLASAAFYRALLGPLGYEPGSAGEGWQILQGREDSLCLVQTDVEHLEPDFHRKRTGLNHLTFRVGTREAFQEYLHVLEQLRVPLLYGGPLEREDRWPATSRTPTGSRSGSCAASSTPEGRPPGGRARGRPGRPDDARTARADLSPADIPGMHRPPAPTLRISTRGLGQCLQSAAAHGILRPAPR